MTRRLLRITIWLLLCAVDIAILYWALVNTPDANALMLAASALLVVLLVIAAGTGVGAALWLARDHGYASAFSRAARGLPWFLLVLLLVALVWEDVVRTDAWVLEHSGEISAWFIARFGWEDISWLFTIETWLSRWLRWAFAPILALVALDAIQTGGGRALVSTVWLRRLLHWRTLGAATLVFVLLFVLPWQLATWRPALPPTWIEVAVAAARLGLAALLILVGCALLVVTAAARARPARPAEQPLVAQSVEPPQPATTEPAADALPAAPPSPSAPHA